MEQKVGTQQKSELVEGSTSAELVKMIRKLRWIGLEEEARQLQAALDRFPPGERAALLAMPRECD